MAIKIVVDGQEILKPGAYGTPKVSLTAGFLAIDQGIVGLVGESSKGFDGATEGIQEFTSAQVSDIAKKYESGDIVEASRAVVQPGRGTIINGAGNLKIYKTNASTQATSEIKNIDDANAGAGDDLFDVKSKSAGLKESLIHFKIASGVTSDDKPSVQSETITFPLTFNDGDTLVVDVNGTSHTFTASTANSNLGPHADVSALVTALNNATHWSPLKPVIAAAGSATDTIKLTVDDSEATLDGFENRLEYGIITISGTGVETSLAMTTSTTVDSSLDVTEGSAGPVRGSRGTRIFTIGRNDFSETLPENLNEDVLTLRYTGAGTAATMTIQDASGIKKLTTTVTGASGEDLDITLKDFSITELVDLINNNSAYSAVTSFFNAPNIKADVIDYYNAIDIKTLPLTVKKAYKEIEDIVDTQSTLMNIDKKSNVYGQLVTNSTRKFLTGGTRGATTNTNIQEGFDALLNTRCNVVVPLFSRDASVDIPDGITDPNSTYTISSIHSITDTHCRTASNIKNKNERNAYLSIKDTFSTSRSSSRNLNSQYSSMLIQDVTRVDVNGNSTTFQPHILASVCAGIQAGSSIGTDLTYKFLNIDGITHQDFRSDNLGDVENAITDGLLVVERPASGGFRIVAGNTTYTTDGNFAFNRIGTFEAGQFVAYDLRQYLQNIFVGENIVGGRNFKVTTARQISNATIDRLGFYNREGIIVGDDTNDNLGWKDLTVVIEGTTAFVNVTITPTQGISFIVTNITLENIRQIA